MNVHKADRHLVNSEADVFDLIADRVSLIVPCYNVENYIGRFLDSVLEQTWPNIELILVNDGATDGTRGIIEDYLPSLHEKCAEVIVVDQKNAGLAGAVDAGLKHFTGEFLSWPDPDDWMTPDSIEVRVDAMRRHPEVGLIRSNCYRFDEATGEIIDTFFPTEEGEWISENAFEKLVFLNGFKAPIGHFARSSAFLDANRSRSIYFDKRSSQNQQMLLPLAQKYPVLEIGRALGYYCVRDDSRSRMHKTPEAYYQRCLQLLDVAEHVVPTLTYQGDAVEGMKRVRDYHIRNRMLPSLFRGEMQDELWRRLKQTGLRTPKKQAASLLVHIRFCRVFRTFDRISGGLLAKASTRGFQSLTFMGASERRWPE